MTNNIQRYLFIMLNLLWRDLTVFMRNFWHYFIDIIVWPLEAAIGFGYVLPLLGLGEDYGGLMVVSGLMWRCFYESFLHASVLVQDFNTNRYIEFEFSLPIPPLLVLIKKTIFFVIKNAFLSIPILIVGKLILQNRFDLSNFSILKFSLIFIISNIFFGFFCIWLTSWVKNQEAFEHAWTRLFEPMVFWGCYWFSWKTLYKFMPLVANLTLINPITLTIEATRASCFGQEGYLNFWLCLTVLLLEAALLGWYGIKRLQQRLDFVSPLT